MKTKTYRLGLGWTLLLAGAVAGTACERSAEPGLPTAPVATMTASPAPGEQATPRAAAGTTAPDSGSWRQTAPVRVMEDVRSIGTGRVFDAAGYGWRPGTSYAVTGDGSAWVWGYRGERGQADYPVKLNVPGEVQQISGDYVLTTDGQVWKSEAAGTGFVNVPGGTGVQSIQHLWDMSGTLFLLKGDGTVWQLPPDGTGLKKLEGTGKARAIYGTAFSLFVVDDAGKLIYYNGLQGSLRPGVTIGGLPEPVMQLAAGYGDEALIRTASGALYEFREESVPPVRREAADHAKAMAATGTGVFVIAKPDGTVWGWGRAHDNLLGPGRDGMAEEPVPLAGLRGIVELQAGTDHILARDDQSRVYTWGSNMTGQLGRLPMWFDGWTERGRLDRVKAVSTRLPKPYLIREDGTVWGMEAGGAFYQVEGTGRVRTVTGFSGIPVTVDEEGKVRVWGPSFGGFQELDLPYRVRNLTAGDDGLLLEREGGGFVRVKLRPVTAESGGRTVTVGAQVESTSTVEAEGEWTKRVKAMYANSYAYLVLTETGEVYYTDGGTAGPYVFRPVAGLPQVKELAPEAYVRYTLEPSVVRALSVSGVVFEFGMKPVLDAGTLKGVELGTPEIVDEGIQAVSGKLQVAFDGTIRYDPGRWGGKDAVLTATEPIRLLASYYNYAIEGPGSHYHLLVTESGRVALLGVNPWGGQSAVPEPVVVPVK
ncbi:hypothetical protein [Gorillibacterium sp. sgz5001074]|uniref:hypothetical protein n=1 Tax=Gorillibacterium sp. sgz5001074 TaxID=3446695 RepID=UPI003F67BB32